MTSKPSYIALNRFYEVWVPVKRAKTKGKRKNAGNYRLAFI